MVANRLVSSFDYGIKAIWGQTWWTMDITQSHSQFQLQFKPELITHSVESRVMEVCGLKIFLDVH